MDVGLVLSGGMAKGAYQIGALRAIGEIVPRDYVKFLSCASVGVLSGYSYLTEGLDRAAELWRSIVADGERNFLGRILRSDALREKISELYLPDRAVTQPFYCALYDAEHKELVYRDMANTPQDQILRLLRASVAMPVYNRAVKVEGIPYFDGALIDNIPVYPLLKKKLDYVICVYFDGVSYKFESADFDGKVVKIAFPPDEGIRKSLVFRRESIDEMIETGYERTRFILRSVFADGVDDLAAIYRSVEAMNKRSQEGRLRLTVDVLATNLNRITQRLMKRRIL